MDKKISPADAVLTQSFPVPASRCDSTGRLGIPDTFQLLMDIATAHANLLGVGRADFAPRNLYWVTVRTKVRFLRRPAMDEPVVLSTWPEPPARASCTRHYRLCGAGGEVLACGKTQWAIIDTVSGALQPAEENFPAGLPFPGSALDAPYSRVRDTFTEEPFASYAVRSTDIDIGSHMNNCAYIRAFASLFSTAEWAAMDLRELDVQYKTPCHEGDTLLFQRRPSAAGGEEFRASTPDGKTVLLLSAAKI